ncbi:MAG: hypothetical protein AAFO97_09775 [Pseudomonadota bacterium]
MTPHPDFENLNVPQTHLLGAFQLAMLTADDLEEDYAAIMSSAAVLKGLFGDTWPTGWTMAEDETDLHWHHREFTAKRSFAWVIRTEQFGYIGCAYLFPDVATTGSGEAVYWMIDTPERGTQLDAFGPLYEDWLKSFLPEGYMLNVRRND